MYVRSEGVLVVEKRPSYSALLLPDDDDAFYVFLQKQKIALRPYTPPLGTPLRSCLHTYLPTYKLCVPPPTPSPSPHASWLPPLKKKDDLVPVVPAEDDILPIMAAVQQKEGHRAHPRAPCPPNMADVETGKGTQATKSQTSTVHYDDSSVCQRHTRKQTCSGIVDSMRQDAKRISHKNKQTTAHRL